MLLFVREKCLITEEQIKFGPSNLSEIPEAMREAFRKMCRLINETETQFKWQVVKHTSKWKKDEQTGRLFISDNPEDWHEYQEIRHISENGEFEAYFEFDYSGCIYIWVNGRKRTFKNPDERMRHRLDFTKDPVVALEMAEKSIARSDVTRRANRKRSRTLEEKRIERAYAEIQSRLNSGKD